MSNQFLNFFYYNLCHVCKTFDENLKRCSVCKSVAYCSKDHQKRDWKHHKHLCKIIAKSDAEEKSVRILRGFKDFIISKVNKFIFWQNELGRKLYGFEEQIWMFPRVCAVCFSKNVLIDCQNCLNVSYCSEQHKHENKEQHLKHCDSLRLCMDVDLYYFHNEYRPTDISVHVLDDTVKVLPNNLEELMLMYENNIPINNRNEKIHFIIKSDYVAPVVSIIYGLEKSGLIEERCLQKEILTVHIVGADQTEMGWLWKIISEFPFHWIQNLKTLNFFVVGPELQYTNTIDKFASQLCCHCKTRKPETSITFRSTLYHEVVDGFDVPDVVVAFNSGLHEFHHDLTSDDWKGSISSLTKYPNVPLILTAYTLNEIKQDVDIVKAGSQRCVKTILEPQRNPFSNMRPIRDWETENVPVFYINGYIAILST